MGHTKIMGGGVAPLLTLLPNKGVTNETSATPASLVDITYGLFRPQLNGREA